MTMIRVHPDVAQALHNRAPVVALETAVLTTGLPRTPLNSIDTSALPGWDTTLPTNLQTMYRMAAAIRTHGAIPAITALIDGVLRIGLEDDELRVLANDTSATKAGVSDMARLLASQRNAGTTVSGTLIACQRVCKAASDEPIRFFATGGIGGVHRGWTVLPDLSADLRQIAISPTCVVCSGAKSILDLPATLEALEALGVPVLGFRTDVFPQFYSTGSTDLGVAPVDDVSDVVTICRTQWHDLDQQRGVLLANPVPSALAIDGDELERVIDDAEAAARAAGHTGRARTPFLLNAIAHATGERSMLANIALLESNAGLAAEMAFAWYSAV